MRPSCSIQPSPSRLLRRASQFRSALLNFTVTLDGAAGDPTPTGRVDLPDPFNTYVVLQNGSAAASFPAAKLQVGSCTITANYDGDSYYNAAVGTASLTGHPGPTRIRFKWRLNQSFAWHNHRKYRCHHGDSQRRGLSAPALRPPPFRAAPRAPWISPPSVSAPQAQSLSMEQTPEWPR